MRHPRGILADVVGLGKTLQAVNALKVVRPKSLLVVGPRSSHSEWHSYASDLPSDTKVLTINSAKTLLPRYGHWDMIIHDEPHKTLRNRKTTYFKAAEQFTSRWLWELTGTPIVNGTDNLWTLLHLLDAKRFSSYWRFVNQFCYVTDGQFGGKEIHGTRNPEELRTLLKQYMLRRRVGDVFGDLPGLQRQTIKVEMTSVQRRLYDELESELWVSMDQTTVMAPNRLAADMRLRQLLISPVLLGFDDEGAMIPTIIEELPDGEPGVIFTPFKPGAHYIAEKLKGRTSFVLTGDLTGPQQERVRKDFASYCAGGHNPVLVCTIGIATSFSLPESCRVAIFAGFDWTPTENEQAEGRIFRAARGDHAKIAKYIVHFNSIDEHIVEILDGKYTVANTILNRKQEAQHG